MEKKKSQPNQKTTSLRLRTETLRRLDDSKLQGVIGGVRIWKPVGDDDATTDTTTG